MMHNYNKLVRDEIVKIIEKRGANVKYRVLDDEEHLKELDKKLLEEVNEFIEAHNEEEMADLMEVIEAVIKQRGMSLQEIQKIKAEKKQKRGGFEDKIFLISVEEKDKDKTNSEDSGER